MEAKETIAVIGMGLMGSAMARRYLDQGYPVLVANRTVEKTRPLEEAGAAVLSPEKLLEASGFVLSILRDFQASQAVLLDPRMNWKNRYLVQAATIGADESRQLASQIEARGGSYLEAPVLGSVPQALSGTLVMMVGGEIELFRTLKPLLSVLASVDLSHVGPVGSAAVMKLAFNQLIASLTTAFATSHAYLRKEDVSMDQFMTLLRKSALYAPTFDKKLAMMDSRQFGTANFSLENMHKDAKLIEAAYNAQGISTCSLNGVLEIMNRALDKGFGKADYSSLYEGVFEA